MSLSLRRSFRSRKLSIKSISISKRLEEEGEQLDNHELSEDIERLSIDREDCWSKMLPELLGEIIQRVESSEDRWPFRKDVVSCACVCKRWRDVTKGIVRSPLQSGKITFPSSLKQPGPSDAPLQCFIKRNKKNSTFYLYLGITQTFMDKGKFLLAARRFRHGAHSEYIISLDADDLSQGSNAYVGKLSSDFLGTKFTIFDSQPPYSGAKPSGSRAGRRFASKQISPQVSAGNFEIGQVSYKFNLLKSRGPRRMLCALQCPLTRQNPDHGISIEEEIKKTATLQNPASSTGCMVLKNKAPRWHEHLQCWCLNFHGRVTVASVKNFQLVATVDPNQPGSKGDEETVLLQFGKVGDDIFTMDYRHPLSAFQAFAICLTSFGTKLACDHWHKRNIAILASSAARCMMYMLLPMMSMVDLDVDQPGDDPTTDNCDFGAKLQLYWLVFWVEIIHTW